MLFLVLVEQHGAQTHDAIHARTTLLSHTSRLSVLHSSNIMVQQQQQQQHQLQQRLQQRLQLTLRYGSRTSVTVRPIPLTIGSSDDAAAGFGHLQIRGRAQLAPKHMRLEYGPRGAAAAATGGPSYLWIRNEAGENDTPKSLTMNRMPIASGHPAVAASLPCVLILCGVRVTIEEVPLAAEAVEGGSAAALALVTRKVEGLASQLEAMVPRRAAAAPLPRPSVVVGSKASGPACYNISIAVCDDAQSAVPSRVASVGAIECGGGLATGYFTVGVGGAAAAAADASSKKRRPPPPKQQQSEHTLCVSERAALGWHPSAASPPHLRMRLVSGKERSLLTLDLTLCELDASRAQRVECIGACGERAELDRTKYRAQLTLPCSVQAFGHVLRFHVTSEHGELIERPLTHVARPAAAAAAEPASIISSLLDTWANATPLSAVTYEQQRLQPPQQEPPQHPPLPEGLTDAPFADDEHSNGSWASSNASSSMSVVPPTAVSAADEALAAENEFRKLLAAISSHQRRMSELLVCGAGAGAGAGAARTASS